MAVAKSRECGGKVNKSISNFSLFFYALYMTLVRSWTLAVIKGRDSGYNLNWNGRVCTHLDSIGENIDAILVARRVDAIAVQPTGSKGRRIGTELNVQVQR